MSAAEASKNFSTVLDTQRSTARRWLLPVPGGGSRLSRRPLGPNGAALREVFRRWQDNPALDDDFAERVIAARTAVSVELDTDPWHG